jgi:hypothetical protein
MIFMYKLQKYEREQHKSGCYFHKRITELIKRMVCSLFVVFFLSENLVRSLVTVAQQNSESNIDFVGPKCYKGWTTNTTCQGFHNTHTHTASFAKKRHSELPGRFFLNIALFLSICRTRIRLQQISKIGYRRSRRMR